MEATINEKAFKAIETFLERRGYDVLERSWSHGSDTIDFIAKSEDGDLVFVDCDVRRSDGSAFPEEELDRESLERVAIGYLATNPDVADCSVRFDKLVMLVIGESRALIRHHTNAMSRELV